MCAQHINNINVITYNVGSLVSHAKRIALDRFIKMHKPDFLLTSETRLLSRYKLALEKYRIFRNDRVGDKVGTAIFIKANIDADRISILGLLTLEVTMVVIKLSNSETLLIAAIYNKCGSSALNINHDLDLLIPTINQHTYTLFGGDFNARHGSWNDSVNSPSGIAIANWLLNNSSLHNLCTISQSNPTFPRSGSTLDFFLVSSNLINIMPQISNYTCNSLISDSDHLAVQLKIALNHQISLNPRSPEHAINLKNIDWKTFKSVIGNDLNTEQNYTNRNLTPVEIELAIDRWQTSVLNALHLQTSPVKQNLKYKDLPEMLAKLFKLRTYLRKKLNRVLHQHLNRINPTYRLISSQINCLTTLINQQTKNFMTNKFHNRLSKIKPGPDTFQAINKIIGRKIPIPDTVFNNTIPICDSVEKAEAFANHFENNFNHNPPNHLPEFLTEVNYTTENLTNTTQTITTFSTSNKADDPIDKDSFTNLDFVMNTVREGNNKKSCGPDGISSYILKKLPVQAMIMLTIIFNNCINLSYFPTKWKSSVIIPIPKKKSATSITDFRPISLINSVSKILEKVMLNKISTVCDSLNIVQNNQFGFKKYHSTFHALIKFHSDTTTNLNKKEVTAACFLDIEKAFDSIWVNGLIYKLLNLGIPRSLSTLILSYLTDRKFTVKINGKQSHPKSVKAGVPQGSVLGPNLFNLFTYDQPANDHSSTTLMYADDSLTYASSISPSFALKKVKLHIEKLFIFYAKWGMKVNCSKSEVLFIRRPHTAATRNAPATECRNLIISINNEQIKSKRKVKYLGVQFTELFKFNSHVTSIISKAFFAFQLIHPLLKIRQGLPTSTKLLLYKQLIRPILMYGFPIWFSISKTYMGKLLKFERKILRICTGLYRQPYSDKFYSNKTLYEKAKIEPIDQYLFRLAKNSISKVKLHNNDLIKNASTPEFHTCLRYIHCCSLDITEFQPSFYLGDKLVFYINDNSHYHRG